MSCNLIVNEFGVLSEFKVEKIAHFTKLKRKKTIQMSGKEGA